MNTELDWDEAGRYLDSVIANYIEIGPAGILALHVVLMPLKRRLDMGECTQALYDEIMQTE